MERKSGKWEGKLCVKHGGCGIVEFIICCINQRFNYVTAMAAQPGPVKWSAELRKST